MKKNIAATYLTVFALTASVYAADQMGAESVNPSAGNSTNGTATGSTPQTINSGSGNTTNGTVIDTWQSDELNGSYLEAEENPFPAPIPTPPIQVRRAQRRARCRVRMPVLIRMGRPWERERSEQPAPGPATQWAATRGLPPVVELRTKPKNHSQNCFSGHDFFSSRNRVPIF